MTAFKQADYARADAIWMRLAAQGDPRAEGSIGVSYAKGFGEPQDSATAVFWLRKGAEQGDVDSEVNLGVMYVQGDGVSKDPAHAALWFGRAAATGNSTAEVNLGLIYYNGAGVNVDYARARQLFQQAADQGDAQGSTGLAMVEAAAGPAPPAPPQDQAGAQPATQNDGQSAKDEAKQQKLAAFFDKLIDRIVQEDSRVWVVDRYIAGSTHNSHILEFTRSQDRVVVYSDFRYVDSLGGNARNNSIDDGWVKTVFVKGKLDCLEYHDGFGVCKKLGDLSTGVKLLMLYGRGAAQEQKSDTQDENDPMAQFGSEVCHFASGDSYWDMEAYGGNPICN